MFLSKIWRILRQIRIFGGERVGVARALQLKMKVERFFIGQNSDRLISDLNERKIVKTISIKKRVALIAAASLISGALGASIAKAANATTQTLASIKLTCSVSTTANTTSTNVLLATGGQVTDTLGVTGDLAAGDYLVASGPFAFDLSDATNTANAKSSSTTTKYIVNTAATASKVSVVTTGAVGTGTLSLYTASDALVSTVNLSAVAACDSGTSAANSYVQVSDTAGYFFTAAQIAAGTGSTAYQNGTTAMDTSVDEATSFAVGGTAYIYVYPRDVYKSQVKSGYLSVTATNGAVVSGVAGGNTVAIDTNAGYATQVTVAAPTYGTPLSTTVTISKGSTVLATKQITFGGDAASLKASVAVSGVSGAAASVGSTGTYGAARGSSPAATATNLIAYRVKDSAGNNVKDTGSVWTVGLESSSNSALVNTVVNGRYNEEIAGKGGYVVFNCIDSTKSGTSDVVLSLTNKAGVKLKSAPVTVTCSSAAIDTWTMALDKSSYNTGDVATLTITAKDSNGVAVADSTSFGSGLAIAIGGMTPVATPATTDVPNSGTSAAGIWKYTYTVGTTAGNYVASVQIPGSGTDTAPKTAKVTITSEAAATSPDVAALVKVVGTLLTTFTKQISALIKALGKK